MKARVTIADLAEAAGVSKAAVSLALRDRSQVSKALRDRVKALARKMGYQRDPGLSLIAASRWKNIKASPGVVLAYISTPRLGAEVAQLSREFAILQEYCKKLGYIIEQFHLSEYRNARQLSQTLWSRGIRGVIVSQIYDETFCEKFEWKHFAAVAVNDGYYTPPVDQYTPNYSNAVCQCWQNALAHGYRRPAVALFYENRENYINFVISSIVLKLQHDTLPPEARIPIQFMDPDKPEETRDWINTFSPDIVIGFNDAHYWHLYHLGYKLPSDIAFASMWVHPTHPGLVAGMSVDDSEQLFQAADRVDSLLRAGQFGPPKVAMVHRLNGKWIEGKSIAVGDYPQIPILDSQQPWIISTEPPTST